jgi:membrane fusion protein (multidrug efflux system)
MKWPLIKRLLLVLLCFIVAVGIIAGIKYLQIQAAMAGGGWTPLPEAVTTDMAREEVWQQRLEAPGSFQPVNGVMLGLEVPGTVTKINFESGERVEKDRVLVELDVSVEQAQLKASVARAEYAVLNQERLKDLKENGAISQKEIDDADSQVKQTHAEVEQIKASIDRKTLRAPFDGITGIRQIQLGQYLSPGTPVVSLQTLDPIYINFSLPQQDISKIKIGQSIQVFVDAFPDMTFEGTITAMDPQVDSTMRTLGLQGTLKNLDGTLRPGMFGKVFVILAEEHKYITLPSTSIARAPYGDSVYIVEKMKDPKGKEYLGVRQQFVKVGPYRGEQVAILSGVQTGQEIVTSGLFKLHPGAEVEVNNEVKPADQPISRPPDS